PLHRSHPEHQTSRVHALHPPLSEAHRSSPESASSSSAARSSYSRRGTSAREDRRTYRQKDKETRTRSRCTPTKHPDRGPNHRLPPATNIRGKTRASFRSAG